jgi:hypothetical protein
MKNLAQRIQEKTLAANDDLKDTTNSTRAMREGNKRAAKEALGDLRTKFSQLLLQKASYIVISGTNSQELYDLVVAEKNTLVFDPETFYADVLNAIEPRMYMDKKVDGTMFQGLTNAFEQIGNKIGIQSLPQLNFKAEYQQMISDKEQALELVKKVVSADVGTEILGIYAMSALLDAAIERSKENSFMPVAIIANDETLALALVKDLKRLSPNVFLAAAGKVSKALRNTANSISIKESTTEALAQLLEAVKSKTV